MHLMWLSTVVTTQGIHINVSQLLARIAAVAFLSEAFSENVCKTILSRYNLFLFVILFTWAIMDDYELTVPLQSYQL